jgi:hypothetical protein
VNYRIGQKVVCIHEPNSEYYKRTCARRPVEKGVYTVRGTMTAHGEVGLYLEEIINQPYFFLNAGYVEQGFHHQHFRPVVETKTDISIFKKMLTPNTREIENA